jgi:hypothetical protein
MLARKKTSRSSLAIDLDDDNLRRILKYEAFSITSGANPDHGDSMNFLDPFFSHTF